MQHNLIDYVGIGVWESKKIVLSVKNIAEVLCKPRSNQLIHCSLTYRMGFPITHTVAHFKY